MIENNSFSPLWPARLVDLSLKLRRHLDRLQPPDSLILLLTSLLVGTGTGLGAVAFVWLLARIRDLVVLGRDLVGAAPGLLIMMGLAGLIVGYMVERWAREAKGHGVPEVMEAVALRGGRIRPRVAAVKVLASSITIGAGGSAGREGPIVQVGSALGSTVGQLLHFSEERIRTLVACGAAAGIAASFNAPIAGTIFALEVILGRFTARYFGMVVISSVSAAVIGQLFLGAKPAFIVPAYPLNNFSEIPIYILLGLLAAVVAVLFIHVLYAAEERFDGWQVPLAVKAALGMLLTALIALLIPDGELVLGSGIEIIGEVLAEDFEIPLRLMLTLLFLKMLATTFTLGSGNSGGVFAPSLFMGAMLGGVVGTVANILWPSVAVHPGAYAIVGMAAVFSGAARAPITAILIVFEMSNDYKLILPLMLSTVLSTFLAEFLFHESIYTLKLKLKGITLQQGRDVDIMQGLLVKEAMTRDPYIVEETMPLAELGAFFQQTHSHSFPVVDNGHRLVGIVSITDHDRALAQDEVEGRLVRDIATMGDLLIAYEEEPVADALQRLGVRDVNKLPVVSRANPDQVTGVIRRRDIIKAYNMALSQRQRAPRALTAVRLQPTDQAEFLDIELPQQSPAANRSLAALSQRLPDDCVIVAVRRQGTLLIPHGDTVLQAGDQITAFVGQKDHRQLYSCLLGTVIAAEK